MSLVLRYLFTLSLLLITCTGWAGEKTLRLTVKNLKLSAKYAKVTTDVNGFSFTVDQGCNGSGGTVQMNGKRGSGTLYNTTPIPGLKRIIFTVSSCKDFTVTGGATSCPATNPQAGRESAYAKDISFDFNGTDTYFQLKVSDGASYFSWITIIYDDDSVLEPPTLTTPTLFAAGDFTVNITHGDATAALHYTLDGSTPTSESPRYDTAHPLTLSATTTVKAIAVKQGSLSEVATATYTHNEAAEGPHILTLDESEDNTAVLREKAGTGTGPLTINLYRQLTAGMWNAICLPVSLDSANMKRLFGDSYLLLAFTDATANGTTIHLKFSPAQQLTAGTPYLVRPSQTVERGAVALLTAATIEAVEPQSVIHTTTNGLSYTFTGLYTPTPFTADDKHVLFIGANDRLYYPNKTTTIRAFRAYFQLPETSAETKIDLQGDDRDKELPTVLTLPTTDKPVSRPASTRVYTVTGQYMGAAGTPLKAGVYIVNGKKKVVK